MNASVFYQSQQAKDQDERRAPSFDYSKVILRAIQGQWWLHSIRDYKDEKFGEPRFGFMKVAYNFVKLVPGAENAKTEAEQLKFRQMGHGKFLRIEVNPVCTAPGYNKQKDEATKPSNMYLLHCVLLNDGEPLTPEQLGEADDATIKAWMAEYNKAAEAGDNATMAEMSGMTVKDLVEAPEVLRQAIPNVKTARMRYAAAVLAKQIAAIEAAHPQVYATPVVKTRLDKVTKKPVLGSDGKPIQYNKLYKADALVPEDAQFPVPEDWAQAVAEGRSIHIFEKPYDEREADDDESLVCADCGKHTRGYERRTDKVWVSNTEAAETSIEQHGRVLCGICTVKAKKAAEEGGEDEE